MAIMLIKLNGAPVDEIDELRQLLADHQIDFYETDAGRWGISIAAIWLRDDSQAGEARKLVDEYQRQRTMRIRNEHETQRRAGTHETLLKRFVSQPVSFLLYLLVIIAVLLLTLGPFIGLL